MKIKHTELQQKANFILTFIVLVLQAIKLQQPLPWQPTRIWLSSVPGGGEFELELKSLSSTNTNAVLNMEVLTYIQFNLFKAAPY